MGLPPQTKRGRSALIGRRRSWWASSARCWSPLWFGPATRAKSSSSAGRAALKTVSRLVSAQSQAYLNPAAVSPEVDTLQQVFDQQLVALRNLRQAGARESTVFAARLSQYDAFLVTLSGLFQAGLDLGQTSRPSMVPGPDAAGDRSAVSRHWRGIRSSKLLPDAPGELLRSGRLDEAFARFEAKVNALRARGVLLVAPVDQALALAGSLAALQSLCDELNQLRRAMAGLPRVGQPLPLAPKANREVLPAPDWFWVRVAIKGGLTAVIAIICFAVA